MSLLINKHMVLEILVENLKNSQPQPVDSIVISERLNMGEKDTCQLIKAMDALGMVESDQDGQRSLITRHGLLCFNEMQFSRAA